MKVIRTGREQRIGRIRITPVELLEINCRTGHSGTCCHACKVPVSVTVQTPEYTRTIHLEGLISAPK